MEILTLSRFKVKDYIYMWYHLPSINTIVTLGEYQFIEVLQSVTMVQQVVKFCNGNTYPILGLGTWQVCWVQFGEAILRYLK